MAQLASPSAAPVTTRSAELQGLPSLAAPDLQAVPPVRQILRAPEAAVRAQTSALEKLSSTAPLPQALDKLPALATQASRPEGLEQATGGSTSPASSPQAAAPSGAASAAQAQNSTGAEQRPRASPSSPAPGQDGQGKVDLTGRSITPGNPDAGSQQGHDVATPPSAPASSPKLNLDLPRPMRGGPISSRSSGGLFELLAHPPETKTKLQKGIEESTRKDCREAYADKGLLAALPLGADAARDKGCRW